MRKYSRLFIAALLIGGPQITLASAPECEIVGISCSSFEERALHTLPKAARDQLNQAWAAYPSNKSPYVVLFDVSEHSSTKRFHVINRDTGTITSYLAAHGRGSDPDHDGWFNSFSDQPGSKATPSGAFRTAETYVGRHGYSLKLDGLEDHNANARDRAIVIHGADYVRDGRNPIGRSWGCPALDPLVSKDVIDKIKQGALLVIVGPKNA